MTMIVLSTSADVYKDICPGEVRWIELARGEVDLFVMRVEGYRDLIDSDGYYLGCVCDETLIWTTIAFLECSEERREKLYRSAMEIYEESLMRICEEMKNRSKAWRSR